MLFFLEPSIRRRVVAFEADNYKHPALGILQSLCFKVTSKHPQQVNRGVSFHAIQSEALNLLSGDLPIDTVLKKLHALFLTNPTLNKNKLTTPRNIKT